MKKAFTMTEMAFVIVILGILAGMAIPRLFATRADAKSVALIQDFANFLTHIDAYYISQGSFPETNGVIDLAGVLNMKKIRSNHISNAKYYYSDNIQCAYFAVEKTNSNPNNICKGSPIYVLKYYKGLTQADTNPVCQLFLNHPTVKSVIAENNLKNIPDYEMLKDSGCSGLSYEGRAIGGVSVIF